MPAVTPPASRPEVTDRRLARHTNHDARRPPDTASAQAWSASVVDFAVVQASGQIFRALSPMLRALGFRDRQLLRIAPLLTHLGAVVYRADREIEARQLAAGGEAIEDVWTAEILAILDSFDLATDDVRAAISTLPELVALETALLHGSITGRDPLLRMIELRPYDLVLTTLVAARISGRPEAAELVSPLRELFVLRDLLDDVRSTHEDARAGTFNALNVAQRTAGVAAARTLLDEVVRVRDGRIVAWLQGAPDSAVRAFAVALAEPVDDKAAESAWAAAALDTAGARTAMIDHFALQAARGFKAQWAALDAEKVA